MCLDDTLLLNADNEGGDIGKAFSYHTVSFSWSTGAGIGEFKFNIISVYFFHKTKNFQKRKDSVTFQFPADRIEIIISRWLQWFIRVDVVWRETRLNFLFYTRSWITCGDLWNNGEWFLKQVLISICWICCLLVQLYIAAMLLQWPLFNIAATVLQDKLHKG